MNKDRQPPGPRQHLLLGNLLELRRDPLGFFTRCAREYGDVVAIRVVVVRGYFINHPDLIEHVLVTHNRKFMKGRALRLSKRFLGEGLLTSEGDFWLRQRRLSQPAFHRQRIAGYADIMVSSAERVLDQWRDGETRDVHAEMMRLTLDIVSKSLFGAETSGHSDAVSAAIGVLMEQFVSLIRFSPERLLPEFLPTRRNRAYRSAAGRLDAVIYDILRERRANGRETGDLLSLLLHAQDEDGSRMTDRQLRDEVMTLFLAGHETTANALSWAWWLLAQHPDAEAKLHAELRDTLGGRAPALDDLPRLRYTEWVIHEAMRLYPPAWAMGREALEEIELGGYRVPRGTQVLMSQWVMHRDARYFSEPEAFRPERWDNDLARRLPKFAYFPFGGGPRLCIGNLFAMMEAALVLATVAQRYRLALVPGQQIIPWPTITLRPRPGIKMTLMRR
jgi:cytochrome P450